MHSNSLAENGNLLQSFFPNATIPENTTLQGALKRLIGHSDVRYAHTAAKLLNLCVAYHEKRLKPRQRLRNSEEVFYHFHERMRSMRQEVLILMLLDAKNRFHSDALISVGDENSSGARIQDVLFPVMNREGASQFVVVRNHPGGSISPSEADVTFTELLQTAAGFFNLNMLDHIIITENRYYSFTAKAPFSPLCDRRNRKIPNTYR